MRLPKLGARLECCASFVRPGSRVADIGTDHALLPIVLVESGVSPRAVASDIGAGPIASARENISRRALEDKIDTFLAPGLDAVLSDTVDDIVIAGMGAELIVQILSAAQWVKDEHYRLILQPMSRAHLLRAFLWDNGFEIIEERCVSDAGWDYIVLCAQYCARAQEYTTAQSYIGQLAQMNVPCARRYLLKQARNVHDEAMGARARGEEERYLRLVELEGALIESSKNIDA